MGHINVEVFSTREKTEVFRAQKRAKAMMHINSTKGVLVVTTLSCNVNKV